MVPADGLEDGSASARDEGLRVTTANEEVGAVVADCGLVDAADAELPVVAAAELESAFDAGEVVAVAD